VALAGFDYVIMATDGATDLTGARVLGSDVTRLLDITDTATLASVGCKPGVDQLGIALSIRKTVSRKRALSRCD
jgi:hypothetical protein